MRSNNLPAANRGRLVGMMLAAMIVSASVPGIVRPGAESDRVLELDRSTRAVVWSEGGKLFASISTRRMPAREGEKGPADIFETIRIHDARTGKELHSLGELKNPGGI
jgi:hypothetical protein